MVDRLMNSTAITNIIEIKANPAIINGRNAYFVGYDGAVYKISISENNLKELSMKKFPLNMVL